MGVLGSMRIMKTYAINLCHNLDDFLVDAEWVFFAPSHEKSHDGIGKFVKMHVTERTLRIIKF